MRIKRKNGLKMIVIALVLLLCLALAVGITGAYYQAKRQATGTLNMDQGIVIDYNGFDKTAAEDWATWTRGVTLPLFSTTDAQPGEHIAVNAAGIRANAKSVDFYARVKLSYKFYNNDTEVTLANASDLITTSANFFGTNWVDGGSTDGYYYYATGTSLNKFNKDTQTFVDLFATGAEFVIEGEHFTGATSDGEGGGFKIDETTSINKIEVYLTLETLQGDADAAAEGWKIASKVDFAKVKDNATFVKTGDYSEGASETNYTDAAEIEEMQNVEVTIDDGITSPLNEIKFSYGKKTTLEFNSTDVEYIQLKYKDGDSFKLSQKFEDTQETGNTKITVLADDSEEVVGYVVGWFSTSNFNGYAFTNKDFSNLKFENTWGEDGTRVELNDKLTAISQASNLSNGNFTILRYFGSETDITIPSSMKIRERTFKYVIPVTSSTDVYQRIMFDPWFYVSLLPITVEEIGVEYTSYMDLMEGVNNYLGENSDITSLTFTGKLYVQTSNIFTSKKQIVYVAPNTFGILGSSDGQSMFSDTSCELTSLTVPGEVELLSAFVFSEFFGLISTPFGGLNATGGLYNENSFVNNTLKSVVFEEGTLNINEGMFACCYALENVTLPESLKNIRSIAFTGTALKSVTIPNNVESIGYEAFYNCKNLESVVLGKGINSLGEQVFMKCINLKNITIPANIKTISKQTFMGCTSLSDVTIENGVELIDTYAFSECTSLTSITIPNSVKEISAAAFRDSTNLTTTISEVSGNWVYANNGRVSNGSGMMVEVKTGDAVSSDILLKYNEIDIKRA